MPNPLSVLKARDVLQKFVACRGV